MMAITTYPIRFPGETTDQHEFRIVGSVKLPTDTLKGIAVRIAFQWLQEHPDNPPTIAAGWLRSNGYTVHA